MSIFVSADNISEANEPRQHQWSRDKIMKGIYEAYDRAGMVRYVGMAFRNVHKRCIHVNRLWCANKNVRDFVRRNGSLTLKCFPMPDETDRDIRIEEARRITLYGRVDLGTGTLLNGNDGEFGPYNYDPRIRRAAAIKAAANSDRRAAALKAARRKTPEQRSRAARKARSTIRSRRGLQELMTQRSLFE
jgi:hypothetical protein